MKSLSCFILLSMLACFPSWSLWRPSVCCPVTMSVYVHLPWGIFKTLIFCLSATSSKKNSCTFTWMPHLFLFFTEVLCFPLLAPSMSYQAFGVAGTIKYFKLLYEILSIWTEELKPVWQGSLNFVQETSYF